MKLEKWLSLTETPIRVFAEKIGEDEALIHKYIDKNVIPKQHVMVKIYCETCTLVRADDFYGLSEEMFDKPKKFNINN